MKGDTQQAGRCTGAIPGDGRRGDEGQRGGDGLGDEQDGRVGFAVCVCAFAPSGCVRRGTLGASSWVVNLTRVASHGHVESPCRKSNSVPGVADARLDKNERSSQPLMELGRKKDEPSHMHDHR
ncbi:hypothetical protein FIBSPDRAFT_874213 [Athelia psychrophila]|uniref:Uncharacterized protein n=1 Tax=Athelia psychrophila TaxID=1759441 RepID=A0A165XPP5_9AGAM|nr:hypothetical protein FIBSPDRAFT_874213 [Fibularhizoctonia sp. CBS 109695]